MSQIQVTGEAKIRDLQGPVVANSGVITALDGLPSQYVRGDGTLADIPSVTGGGASVSYYLNGSVNQGTFGGSTYYQLGETAITGVGTNFSTSTDGLLAQFITDIDVPDQTEIPSGNWNIEFYMGVSASSGALASFYVEIYKYDGSTFTLVGSNVTTPEFLTNTTTVDAYFTSVAMPFTVLAQTDRIAIRVYASVASKTVTMYTEDNRLCQVVTTFSRGMLSLNSLTDQQQYLTVGTAGTDFNIVSSVDTHTFNIPVASATNTGKLSSTDWSTFHNKQDTLTFTAPLDNTGNIVSIPAASSTVDGYLDNADWTTFNNKQNAISLTTTGSSGSSTFIGDTLNVPTYTLAGLGGISLTSLSATSPLLYNNTTGVFSIQQATTSQNGYLSSTDWNTFNNKASTAALDSYLPLAGGIMTGTLTNTLSSGSNIILNKGTGPAISFNKTNATAQSWIITTDPNFRIIDDTATTVPLQIALGTGAATFLSTITATQGFFSGTTTITNNDQSTVRLKLTNTGGATSSGYALVAGVAGTSQDGFSIYDYTNSLTRLYVNSIGNVGIGTIAINPAARLQVKTGTNINFAVQTGTFNTTGIKLNAFNDVGDTNVPLEINGSILYLKTGETNRITISGTGTATFSNNIAVGSTLSAWGSPFAITQYPYGSYSGGTTSGAHVAGNNNYYDGSVYKYALNDYATLVTQGGGDFYIRTAPSGTANNTITWTERFRVTNGGSVLMGSTTDPNFRLFVDATGKGGGIKVTRPAGSPSISGNTDLVIEGGGTGPVYLNAYGSGDIYNNLGGGNTVIGAAVSGGGKLQVNGNVNINGVFQINGVTIGGGGGSGVTGSGTTNYVTKWTGSSTLGNSLLFDNGTSVGVGTAAPFSTAKLQIKTTTNVNIAFQTGTFDSTGMKINAFNDAGSVNIPIELNGTILYFKTSETVKGMFTNGGNFLIGTTTDNGYKVNLNGSISFAYGYTSIFRGSSAPNDILVGNTGSTFYVGGSVSATGGFFDTSDSRLKTLITDNHKAKGIENVSAKLYLKNGKEELGYYAQDLQEILPSAVVEGADGLLTLSYSQVHTAKIAYLEDKIAKLEEIIKTLL